MKRSLVRSVSVLIAILALTLTTMAAPAFAGNASGAGGVLIPLLLLPGVSPGDCAWVYDQTTTHFFVGFATGAAPQLTGALRVLPPQFGSLTIAPDGTIEGVSGSCQYAGPIS